MGRGKGWAVCAIISTTRHWISRGQMINPPLPPFRKGGMEGFESGFLRKWIRESDFRKFAVFFSLSFTLDGCSSYSPSLLFNWEQNKKGFSGGDRCRGSHGAVGREKIKDGLEVFLQIRLCAVRSAFKFRLLLFRFFLSGRGGLFLFHLQLGLGLADEINQDPRADNN